MNSVRAVRPLHPSSLSQNIFRTNRVRPFSSSDVLRNEEDQKEAQLDRGKMNTERREGTKTGTDDSTTAQSSAAFNPNITQPQAEKEEAGKGNEHNPLDASGANPELGRPTEEDAPGAGTKTRSGSRK